MTNLNRLIIFLVVFIGMNLVFVPLLSLYGLRVCPVLSIPGFGFGCYYAGAFILIANLLNLSLIAIFAFGQNWFNPKIVRHVNRIWLYAGAYIAATVVALVLLQVLLKMNHLTTNSRAPEILTLASFLLCITQVYGLNWALPMDYGLEGDAREVEFKRSWLAHVARTMLPIAVVGAVLLHFLISQAQGFNEGKTAPIVSHDDFIEQVSYVIIFLIGWLVPTFAFHFLSERDHVGRIQLHLNHVRELDFKFRSMPGTAWGLWGAILSQLNSFSKILGERSRLLKTFSRFVTAGVAEKALHQELTETSGITKELTVLMSDIRNFTGMSEVLPPNQVVSLLNEYFSAMLDVISNFQITVDKFIGDGILAYVEPDENSSSLVSENRLGVDAALAMIARVEKLNLKLREMGLPEIKIGIGIFRGPLVIGLIGSEAKLQHTIIGDTVNRTARLESLCKELGVSVVISGRIWHSLERATQARFKSFGKQMVKGIADPMEVFGGPVEELVSSKMVP